MSVEDREYEKAIAMLDAMTDMVELLSESDDPRYSQELLDEIAATAVEWRRVHGAARDLIKEHKHNRWPTDEWKVKWASERERLELEKEQVETHMKELMARLAAARDSGPGAPVAPEGELRFHEIIGRVGISMDDVRKHRRA